MSPSPVFRLSDQTRPSRTGATEGGDVWEAMIVPDLAVIDVHSRDGRQLTKAGLSAVLIRLQIAGVRAELTDDAVRVSLDEWERTERVLEAVGPVTLSSPWDDCGEIAGWRDDE
jgi:hypothetical protein